VRHSKGNPNRCWTWTLSGCNNCGIQRGRVQIDLLGSSPTVGLLRATSRAPIRRGGNHVTDAGQSPITTRDGGGSFRQLAVALRLGSVLAVDLVGLRRRLCGEVCPPALVEHLVPVGFAEPSDPDAVCFPDGVARRTGDEQRSPRRGLGLEAVDHFAHTRSNASAGSVR
jgi:hypothetical protein